MLAARPLTHCKKHEKRTAWSYIKCPGGRWERRAAHLEKMEEEVREREEERQAERRADSEERIKVEGEFFCDVGVQCDSPRITDEVRQKRPRRRKNGQRRDDWRSSVDNATLSKLVRRKAWREQEAEERAKMRAHSAKMGPAVPRAEEGWRTCTAGGASAPTAASTRKEWTPGTPVAVGLPAGTNTRPCPEAGGMQTVS
jgi:hypothetical protein